MQYAVHLMEISTTVQSAWISAHAHRSKTHILSAYRGIWVTMSQWNHEPIKLIFTFKPLLELYCSSSFSRLVSLGVLFISVIHFSHFPIAFKVSKYPFSLSKRFDNCFLKEKAYVSGEIENFEYSTIRLRAHISLPNCFLFFPLIYSNPIFCSSIPPQTYTFIIFANVIPCSFCLWLDASFTNSGYRLSSPLNAIFPCPKIYTVGSSRFSSLSIQITDFVWIQKC